MTGETKIDIDLSAQQLLLSIAGASPQQYPVSTARNGPGERQDSLCTPRGRHVIGAKIGAGAEVNTVFVGRQPSGEIYQPGMRVKFPDRDWILTRILWLRGQEPGRNAGPGVDSYDRYIYIHGTPDDVIMGQPGSAGCIRMRNDDVIRLFDQVQVGTPVMIRA